MHRDDSWHFPIYISNWIAGEHIVNNCPVLAPYPVDPNCSLTMAIIFLLILRIDLAGTCQAERFGLGYENRTEKEFMDCRNIFSAGRVYVFRHCVE
jgi:hypothetical protein